jgi:hypothetical protein
MVKQRIARYFVRKPNLIKLNGRVPETGGRPTNMHQVFWLRKAKRPDYPTLCEDIGKLGYVGTAKKYNVSDNAIRKWKKH